HQRPKTPWTTYRHRNQRLRRPAKSRNMDHRSTHRHGQLRQRCRPSDSQTTRHHGSRRTMGTHHCRRPNRPHNRPAASALLTNLPQDTRPCAGFFIPKNGRKRFVTIYYQDDQVTLYHGDCITEHREWLTADVLVTDPPYGIRAEARKGSYRGAGTQIRYASDIAGDDTTEARDTAINLWGDRPRIVFGSWRQPRPMPVDHRLIWHKAGSAPGPANVPFMSNDEEIYITGSGFKSSSPPMRTVVRTSEARSLEVARIGHPTPKPVGLMEKLIERAPDGAIADPFAGSGSTLIAARNLGRKAIGVELEEKYCEIIANRLSQGAFDFA